MKSAIPIFIISAVLFTWLVCLGDWAALPFVIIYWFAFFDICRFEAKRR